MQRIAMLVTDSYAHIMQRFYTIYDQNSSFTENFVITDSNHQF